MRNSGLLFLPLFLLAACGDVEPAPEEPAPAASFSPSPPPSATAAAATIPAAFLGAWDWTGGACAEFSELRTDIGAQAITFYESVGTVKSVRADGDVLSVDLDMEGEGMQWEQTTVYTLVEGGTLLETEHDDPTGTSPMRLKRCPAQDAQ